MKNNNVPQEGSDLPAEWGNPDDVFGNETKLTRIFGASNEQKNEEDPFGGKTSQTLHLSGVNNPPKIKPEDIIDISTLKTMKESISNPDNKTNPFDNPIDPFGGETLKLDPMDKSIKTKGSDPFEKGAKHDDPFGGETIKEEIIKKNESVKKTRVDPFEPGAKVDDPFGGETIK